MVIKDSLNGLTFHNDSTYEGYVLGRLTKSEEDLFEEHLLTCEHCQAQLEITEAIILGIKSSPKIEQDRNFSYNSKTAIVRYSVAASLALLLGVSAYFYLQRFNNQKDVLSDAQKSLLDSTHNSKEKDVNSIKVLSETEKSNDKELLAVAYKPNPIFENAIENYVRSGSIVIIKPALSAEVKSADMLSFEWENHTSTLVLVIFNNTGKMIFQKEVSSPFVLEDNLKKGLYYWQLESPNESLFTGKFLII
ncbi:MAG: zf-HC2 domain-containing protein [Bacteroidales bacterium]|nr:MAG: zf-HC2 domain-containing protein [Bacteroidales bacterium]